MLSAQSEASFRRQGPIHSSNGVVLDINRRSVFRGGGAGVESVAQPKPERSKDGDKIDHFCHRTRAPVVLLEHGAVIVNDGDAEPALRQGAPIVCPVYLK